MKRFLLLICTAMIILACVSCGQTRDVNESSSNEPSETVVNIEPDESQLPKPEVTEQQEIMPSFTPADSPSESTKPGGTHKPSPSQPEPSVSIPASSNPVPNTPQVTPSPTQSTQPSSAPTPTLSTSNEATPEPSASTVPRSIYDLPLDTDAILKKLRQYGEGLGMTWSSGCNSHGDGITASQKLQGAKLERELKGAIAFLRSDDFAGYSGGQKATKFYVVVSGNTFTIKYAI